MARRARGPGPATVPVIPGSVGARLRAERERAGLGSNQLCKQAGVGAGVVSRIEANKLGTKSGEMIKRLAKALGLNEDWLLHGTGEKYAREEGVEQLPRVDQHPAWKSIRDAVVVIAPDLEDYLATVAGYRVPHRIDADFALTVARQAQRLSSGVREKN